MDAYIEYVVIDNLSIDFLLVLLARKSLRLKVNKFAVFFSACIGTFFAVLIPLFDLSRGFLYVVRILLAALMVITSGNFRSFREYFTCYNLFLFFTFVFGGAVTAVFYAAGLSFDPLELDYDVGFPLGVIIASALVVYYVSSRIISRIYRRRDVVPLLRKCEIFFGGEVFRLTGFIDSGNRLFYYKTGMPIILCSPKTCEKIRSQGLLIGKKRDVVTVQTVVGKSVIQVYETEKIKIYNGDVANTIYNVMIGFSSRDFSDDGEYDLILNPSLI